MKTRLTNAMRAATARRLIEHHARPREVALRAREHALVTRMLRQRFGADVFKLAVELPPGWLPTYKALGLEYDLQRLLPATRRSIDGSIVRWHHKQSVELAEYAPLPTAASKRWDRSLLGPRLYDDLYGLCQSLHDLEEECATVEAQVKGALIAYFTVEALADGWPEGYAYFPVDMLTQPVANHPLPVPRTEDLNARLATLAQVA